MVAPPMSSSNLTDIVDHSISQHVKGHELRDSQPSIFQSDGVHHLTARVTNPSSANHPADHPADHPLLHLLLCCCTFLCQDELSLAPASDSVKASSPAGRCREIRREIRSRTLAAGCILSRIQAVSVAIAPLGTTMISKMTKAEKKILKNHG